MKIINDACTTLKFQKNSLSMAITVGKFEAMHLGHSRLIQYTVEYACSHGLASAVLSFVPHPASVLSDGAYKPLFTNKETALLLGTRGIDYWIPYPFDQNFSEKSPRDFCLLIKNKLGCRTLLVGEGFRFGHNREGTPEMLNSLGQDLDMDIIAVPCLRFEDSLDGKKISTSQIRAHLAKGQMQRANKLLGKPFLILGTVQKGKRLGHTIGFPTANIYPDSHKFLPINGVYSSKIFIGDLKKTGVTNIGVNPTVSEYGSVPKVEVHIFDFNDDIYGKEILVELYDFIRHERVFSGIKELKQQIALDCKEARRVLAKV